jgi:hypothetical protein
MDTGGFSCTGGKYRGDPDFAQLKLCLSASEIRLMVVHAPSSWPHVRSLTDLATGSDDQVGVRQIRRVEMASYSFGRDALEHIGQ